MYNPCSKMLQTDVISLNNYCIIVICKDRSNIQCLCIFSQLSFMNNWSPTQQASGHSVKLYSRDVISRQTSSGRSQIVALSDGSSSIHLVEHVSARPERLIPRNKTEQLVSTKTTYTFHYQSRQNVLFLSAYLQAHLTS